MMKNEKDNLEQLFNQFKDNWDTEEPTQGHELRFMQRLENKLQKNSTYIKSFLRQTVTFYRLFCHSNK